MSLLLESIAIPLRDDGHGGLRVGQTRVNFESVWQLHQDGNSAEEIVQAFDTLDLADVHAVLAWALRHSQEVSAYLKRRAEEAAVLRSQLEQMGITPTPAESAELKKQLLARRQKR